MDRRRYLRQLGTGLTVGAAALSGCGGDSGGGEGGAGQEEATAAEETEAAGAEATPTEAQQTETAAETGTQTEAGTQQQGSNAVAMVTEGDSYYFDPVGLFVESGTTVTWVNEAGSHSSTAYTQENPQSEVTRIPSDADGWNSETLTEAGAEFTHTFDVAGTYDYYCIPHKSLGMVGRIVVDEPGGVEGDPPDGSLPSPQDIADQGSISHSDFSQ